MGWQNRVGASVSDAKLILKPLLMPTIAVGGFWLGAYQLSLAPWHHLTFIWVGGFAMAIYGGYQSYRAMADRILMARWLDGEDEEAANRAEEATAWAKRLPAGYREAFYARRTALRRAGFIREEAVVE